MFERKKSQFGWITPKKKMLLRLKIIDTAHLKYSFIAEWFEMC